MPSARVRKDRLLHINQNEFRKEQPEKEQSGTPKDNGHSELLRNSTSIFIQLSSQWPPAIHYLNHPLVSQHLTEQQRKWLHRKPITHECHTTSISSTDNTNQAKDTIPTIRLPVVDTASRIGIKLIDDEKHPAHNQYGLFAARNLVPGEFVVPYIGYIHSSTASEQNEAQRQAGIATTPSPTQNHDDTTRDRQARHNSFVEHTDESKSGLIANAPTQLIGSWDKSDYDLNLVREDDIELAVDAAVMGNEARFCNDYRGVPAFVDLAVDLNAKKDWDRRKKRAAKTWEGDADRESVVQAEQNQWNSKSADMAIPNAEFRDVWFEWAVEENSTKAGADEGRTRLGTDRFKNTSKLEQTIDQLDLNSHEDTAKSSDAQQMVKTKRRRKTKTGMRGVAIFVLPAGRSGKRKDGIKAGQEILVSYGKGFWAHHGV